MSLCVMLSRDVVKQQLCPLAIRNNINRLSPSMETENLNAFHIQYSNDTAER